MTPKTTTAVLLAAGRGSRMRELTQNMPKPLLKVGHRTLLEHHLVRLRDQGFKQVIINTAYFGEKIQQHIGDGKEFELEIKYSDESATGALETAGGLRHALDLIKSDPFIVINADIYTDFNFVDLLSPLTSNPLCLGRLVLVDNPSHNPDGDFPTRAKEKENNTFSGIALYRKSMFEKLNQGKQPLGPILKTLIANEQLDTIDHFGQWTDVGTPERLAQLNADIQTVK